MRGRGTAGAVTSGTPRLSLQLDKSGSYDESSGIAYDWRGGKIEPGSVVFDTYHDVEALVVSLTCRHGRGIAELRPIRSIGDGSIRTSTESTATEALILLHPPEEAALLLKELGLPADGRRPLMKARFEDGIAYDWRGLPLLPGTELVYLPPDKRDGLRSAIVVAVEPATPFKLRVATVTGRSPRWLKNPAAVTVVGEMPPGRARINYSYWQTRFYSERNLDSRGISLKPGDHFVSYANGRIEELEVATVGASSSGQMFVYRVARPGLLFPQRKEPFQLTYSRAQQAGIYAVPTVPAAEEIVAGDGADALTTFLADHGIDTGEEL